MKASYLAAGAVGLVIGALLMVVLRPATGLIDGKYLVVQEPDGHWVYEAGDEGLTVRVKQMSATGLQAIWGLQGQFKPYSVEMGGVTLLNVSDTAYSTESGTFQVMHRFYRLADDKLVEVKLEPLKPQ
jgi:hypothetical protein